jgi:uncharacterized membrane protein YkoI
VRVTMLRPLLIGVLAGSLSWAGEASHDRARAALQSGMIVPLDEVLEVLRGKGIGQILEVELEQHDGRWIDEVEALSPHGAMSTHVVDIGTKAVLPDVNDRDDPRE